MAKPIPTVDEAEGLLQDIEAQEKACRDSEREVERTKAIAKAAKETHEENLAGLRIFCSKRLEKNPLFDPPEPDEDEEKSDE